MTLAKYFLLLTDILLTNIFNVVVIFTALSACFGSIKLLILFISINIIIFNITSIPRCKKIKLIIKKHEQIYFLRI